MAGNLNIVILDEDIVIGRWDPVGRNLINTPVQPDAIEVTARRDASSNGPVAAFFAKTLGHENLDIKPADATAALSGPGTIDEGEIILPVGISRYLFDNNLCNDHITFYPSNDPSSCAGWNTFASSPANDQRLRTILENVALGPDHPDYDTALESPEVVVGDTQFQFIGGTMSQQTFAAMLSAFQYQGFDIDASGNIIQDPISGEPMHDATGTGLEVPLELNGLPILWDPDGPSGPLPPVQRNRHEWETTVAVYDSNDCSNPNAQITIVGSATIKITDIQDAPEKRIVGDVSCVFVTPEDIRGGGGIGGTRGSIPGLVE